MSRGNQPQAQSDNPRPLQKTGDRELPIQRLLEQCNDADFENARFDIATAGVVRQPSATVMRTDSTSFALASVVLDFVVECLHSLVAHIGT